MEHGSSAANDDPFEFDDGLVTPDMMKRDYLKRDYSKSPAAPNLTTNISSFQTSVKKCYVVRCALPVHVIYQEDTAEWKVQFRTHLSTRRMPAPMETCWFGMLPPANVRRSDGSKYSSLTAGNKLGITRALLKENCYVVWIKNQLLEEFDQYCRKVLWPLMHNVIIPPAPDLHEDVKIDGIKLKLWQAYETVNQLFSLKLCALLKAKEIIWVHGYQLMLLPAKLRLQLHSSKRLSAHETPGLIFYLHVPFPTSEIFRTLYHRNELLQGMLGADLIAFHLYNYLRHFLNVCQRLLYVHCEREAKAGLFVMRVRDKLGSMHHMRNVGVRVNSIVSMTPREQLKQIKFSREVQDLANALREKYKGKRILVGIDRCNRMSGMSLKLLAFEHLLNTDKETAEGVVLVQRCIMNGEMFIHPVNEQALNESNELLTRIRKAHGKPGEPLVDFEVVEHVTKAERVALWLVGEVYVNCAVREGINLKPFEYVFCQEGEQCPGAVIISEFSGVAHRFGVEHRINPYNIADVANKIAKVLDMDLQLRKLHHKRNLLKLTKSTSNHWTMMVLRDIKNMWLGWQTKEEDYVPLVRDSSWNSFGGLKTEVGPEVDCSFNPGYANLEIGFRQQHVKRSVNAIINKYATSKRRLVLLFDHIHTSKPAKQQVSTSWILRPTAVNNRIHALASKPQNQVFVVSSPLCSLEAFKERFSSTPSAGLVMHDGSSYSWPAKSLTKGREWINAAEDTKDTGWRNIAHRVLKEFSVFINGSKVTSTPRQVRLDYSRGDRDWGSKTAAVIVKKMRFQLSNEIAAISTPPFLDVRPKNIRLRAFVAKTLCFMRKTNVHVYPNSPPLKPIVIDKAETSKPPGFILCIGHDSDAQEIFGFLDDTSYTNGFAPQLKMPASARTRTEAGQTKLVPLAYRLPKSCIVTLSLHKQHSSISPPFSTGRYFVNGVEDVNSLLRSLVKAPHITMSLTQTEVTGETVSLLSV